MVRGLASLEFAGSASSLSALGRSFRELLPDVLLIDLPRPDPQFLNDLRTALQAPTVLLLGETEPAWVARALRHGVRAVLDPEAGSEAVRMAVEAAHDGLVLLDPGLTTELATLVRAETSDIVAIGDLTAREIDVLRLLAEGKSNKDIAAQLGISDHTAKFHISSILGKLGAESRTEAVTIGVRKGLILL